MFEDQMRARQIYAEALRTQSHLRGLSLIAVVHNCFNEYSESGYEADLVVARYCDPQIVTSTTKKQSTTEFNGVNVPITKI